MATNVFVTLTPPSSNGSGAAVDVSTMGAAKTISVGSSGGVYEPNTTIEVSQNGTQWAPVATFQGKSEKTVVVACKYMRQTVGNYKDGAIPTVGVGSDDGGATQTTLSVPVASGFGSPSVTSSLRTLKSVQVGGEFRGTLNVQISDDGGVTYTTIMSFTLPGVQTAAFTADHMRIHRTGVPTVSPGLPSVIVSDSGSSGGGGDTGSVRFLYNADGSETSPFVMTIPARASLNFAAQVTGGGMSFVLEFDVVQASNTLTSILVMPSAPLTAGDVLVVDIKDLS